MARKLILVACAMLMTGCGGAGSGSSSIDFQVAGDPEEMAAYRELVKTYARETGEQVRLIEVGDREEHLAKLTTSFAGGRPPDVFLVNHRHLAEFARRGVVAPAGDELGRPGGLRERDLAPITVDAFRYEGVLQCVPQNASSLVVYYNRDAFERAGVRLPSAGWRYGEFLAAARILAGDGEPAVGIAPEAIRLAPFIWSAGGEIVDDLHRPTRLTLDTPESLAGLRALLRLAQLHLTPTRVQEESQPSDARFIAGSLPMFFSSRREVPVFRTITGFEWDVAPFPAIERPVSVLHADGFCVAAAGDSAAAWRFVRFAASETGQRVLMAGGRTVPSLRALARSPEFLDDGRPPAADAVFADQVPRLRRLPTAVGWERAEEAIAAALEAGFYDGAPVEAVAQRAQREAEGAF